MALAVMRRHRRWLYVFLWLVILTFILLYIPAFQKSDQGPGGDTVATVGGLEITAGQLQKATARQQQMYERMYQGLDRNMLRQLGLDQQAFEGLVAERLVRLEAKRLGLEVGDDELAHYIQTAPEFSDNGRHLGGAEIKRLLEMRGITQEEFADALRTQLLREKLEAFVTDGVVVTEDEARAEYRRRNEKVKLEYVHVPAASFDGQVNVTDDEVKARFESRKEDYRFPERRVLSYVLLGPEALRSRVSLTESDLQSYFDANMDQFRTGEQACASHILVNTTSEQNPAGHPDAEARALAQKALDQVRAGADFATMARAMSEDPGSKDNGGDLGCFARGAMVPEFEKAAFALQDGQVSDLVKSPYGYHVIRMNRHMEDAVPQLADVRERIRTSLGQQRAKELAEQQAARMTALLAKGRSLDEAARELGLTVATSEPVALGVGATPPLAPSVVTRAFELKAGETSPESYRVPTGTVFVAVKDVIASKLPELKEVQDRIRTELRKEKAMELAQKQAVDLRAMAETAGLDKAAKVVGLQRAETPATVGREERLGDAGPLAALEPLFALEPGALSAPVKAPNGYVVARAVEKTSVDPSAFVKEKDTLVAALRDERRGRLFQAFMNAARERFKVERNPEVYQRVVG